MYYEIKKNSEIRVYATTEFDAKHIFDCGQTFRYRNTDDCYTIFSKNKNCLLQKGNDCVIIDTDDTDYFVDYFDLNRNYGEIKESLAKYNGLKESLEYGYGIRILNQDPYEMIMSFIVSANNNIPRIKGILERICENLGEKNEFGYSFPTPEKMASADESFFYKIGAGYRSPYLVETANRLLSYDLNALFKMNTSEARKELMKLKGIGGKVADCILLFAYHKTDVFPMDTWSKKIYDALGYEKEKNTNRMSERLVRSFGDMSGYAQQYLFYYYRNGTK